MSGYYQIAWLPLCGGLTAIGLVLSWLAWRRRGVAAGLRGAAWSLLPLAAYLLGVVELLWRFGAAIASFAGSFVFSPLRWAGVIVAGLSVIGFAVSARLRRRRGRSGRGGSGRGAAAPAGGGHPAASGQAGRPGALPAAKPAAKGKADDDDLDDVAEILRRRGIR